LNEETTVFHFGNSVLWTNWITTAFNWKGRQDLRLKIDEDVLPDCYVRDKIASLSVNSEEEARQCDGQKERKNSDFVLLFFTS
jgi:hypothetical protein